MELGGEECAIVRSMKRAVRVYTFVGPYERHKAWTHKGGDGRCVCMLYAGIAGEVYRSVCVGKELWRLWENDLKKKINVPGG